MSAWQERDADQIAKLLEIIREQRTEIIALRARLQPRPVNPELVKHGQDLFRFVLQGGGR